MSESQNEMKEFLNGLDAMSTPDPFAAVQGAAVPTPPAMAPQSVPQAPTVQQPVTQPVQVPSDGQPIIPAATWPAEQPQQTAPVQQVPQQPIVQAQPAAPTVQPSVIPQTPAPQPQETIPQSDSAGTQQGIFDPFEQAQKLAASQQNDRMLEALKQKRAFFSYGKVKDEIENETSEEVTPSFCELEIAGSVRTIKNIAVSLPQLADNYRAALSGNPHICQLNLSQIGLVGASGLMNGIIECEHPHVIKGKIVKQKITEKIDSGKKGVTEVHETTVNKMVFNILTPQGFLSVS